MCENNEAENVVPIDVDSDSLDSVNIEVPKNLAKKPRRSNGLKSEKSFPLRAYIYIDDDDEKSVSPVNLSKRKRMYPGRGPNNSYGPLMQLDGDSGDDDGHDCEFMVDSSGMLQKQWEKASSKRKVNVRMDKCEETLLDSTTVANGSDTNVSLGDDHIFTERENLKETDEYKRALEEELLAREQALKVQAEEAKQQRRLLKRKEAEQLRLLDMERRQQQRVEEIRESQKQDTENMNLKEMYRIEVCHDLRKLEMTCHDMASLLRKLGMLVDNGCYASSHEVHAAYKRALLSFHPDRASRSDMRQQVEAEEKFKLISRMKDNVLMIK
ncbi:dnaJ domain-containing protein [Artemisia annua]|uniref:DnaJ domain-containing protein n=1 Tax=Artemisia annua TaxID=35608 RepID=A0A2U1M6F5_ARTAN|nr:dnaJ domain-containing protein [Artemisia annua]